MPYIGRSPTNSGQFANIDEISGSFNGSTTSFDVKVGTVAQTPDPANTIISLNGVLQHFPEAYTISGSKIIFSEAPPSDTKFYGIEMTPSEFDVTSFSQTELNTKDLKNTIPNEVPGNF